PASESAAESADTAGQGPDPTFRSAPAAARSPRRTGILVAIAVVAVAVAVVLALLFTVGIGGFRLAGSSTPALVHVNELDLAFSPSSNACFPYGFQSTHPETVAVGGELLYNVSLQDVNPGGAHACTVTGLVVNTSGFTVVASDLPLVVGTGSATLDFTLSAPSAAFNGSVLVTANVTFLTPDVHVSAQNFHVAGGGGSCGTIVVSGIGFSGFSGSTYADSTLATAIFGTSTCHLTQLALSSAPTGFSIVSSSLPIAVPQNSFSGFTFALQLPPTSYQGELNYTVTAG
ncbi:MAG: hypothetical protein L3K06_02610, partial [Thermoplasmata archaeon]|nr:hypothetical protein [Thermoplasmata archaeon]